MFFELTGAAFAHVVVGDADARLGNVGHILAPLVLKLSEADFHLLAKAFFAEIEAKYV